MKKDLRYLRDKNKFLEFSYIALKEQFRSKNEFISFFNSIEGAEQQNLFLKTASFYLFLVKQGDWIVDINRSIPKVGYLTDTYKYIGLFSLIESLQTEKFIDFYSYLIRRKSKVQFPINDKNKLENWYKKYKEEFGSITQAVSFFKGLSKKRQGYLTETLEVGDAKPSIENLSKYLYELRSKFVHEAELILNMSESTTIGSNGKKIVVCKISIKDLMTFFEEGLVNYFKV
jgi:hypothetical protein